MVSHLTPGGATSLLRLVITAIYVAGRDKGQMACGECHLAPPDAALSRPR